MLFGVIYFLGRGFGLTFLYFLGGGVGVQRMEEVREGSGESWPLVWSSPTFL